MRSFRRRLTLRFPELNRVALWVDDPSELALRVLFSLVVDFHAFSLKLIQ
jgi:hypothetical protein